MTRSQDSLYSETQHSSSSSSCQSIPQTASLEHLGFEETWAGDSITYSHMEVSYNFRVSQHLKLEFLVLKFKTVDHPK